MIELKNVSKLFPQKSGFIRALDDVSLFVPKGKVFGVIGTSGAGKSTLIRCINLLERPSSGDVMVDGQSLLQLSAAGLSAARKEIGMIFQHFNLLSSRTVAENVALPLELSHTPREVIKQRVTELLELVGISDKANVYPVNLSGGQKQRVAIARTLAANPKVLLCDEATSALDPGTTTAILELLKDINRRFQITILLITHEMNVVKAICDEVAVISGGKLVEQGPVSAIFAHPKSEITRQFIASSVQLELPEIYRRKLAAFSPERSRPVLKLEFNGDSADGPVFAEVARLYNVDTNVICAQLDYAGTVKFGLTYAELTGSPDNIQAAFSYYQSKNIKVEVLGYV